MHTAEQMVSRETGCEESYSPFPPPAFCPFPTEARHEQVPPSHSDHGLFSVSSCPCWLHRSPPPSNGNIHGSHFLDPLAQIIGNAFEEKLLLEGAWVGHGGTKSTLETVTAECPRRLGARKEGRRTLMSAPTGRASLCGDKLFWKTCFKESRILPAARAAGLEFPLQMVSNPEAQVCLCTCCDISRLSSVS